MHSGSVFASCMYEVAAIRRRAAVLAEQHLINQPTRYLTSTATSTYDNNSSNLFLREALLTKNVAKNVLTIINRMHVVGLMIETAASDG